MRKKRNRRKTVSGVSGVAFNEVNVSVPCLFGTNVNLSDRWQRQRPCSIAFDHYAPRAVSHQILHHGSGKSMEEPERPSFKRSSSFRKSLRSLFRGSRSKSTTLWVEERPRSPGPPVVDLNMAPPVRRSRSVSLTKSLRSVRESFHKFISSRSVSTDRAHKVERGSTIGQASEVKVHPEPEKVKKPSRMQRIGKKLGIFRSHSQQHKAGGNESPMTRSRSMDMSTVNAVNQKPVHAGIPAYRSTMTLVENHVMVPPDQSWIHRFADVKLRDNLQLAAHHENRQSSSGNWSGSTDSARQSLTSDCTQHAFATVPECSSEASLDKDSAVSLTIHSPNDRLYSGTAMYTGNDDTSTFTAGTTVATDSETGGVKANFTKMSTEEWLKNLNMKRNSCSKLTDHLTTDRQLLTQQNLIAHDQSLTASKGVIAEDDGGSSVYSVDQDGYYTSMHRDSGLTRGGQCANDSRVCGSTPTSAHCIVKSKKNPFFVPNIPRGKTGSQGSWGKAKKIPPPPPPRVSTIQDKCAVNNPSGDSGPSAKQEVRSTGESASKHPCVMSPVDSDVEMDYTSEWQQQNVAQTGLKTTMSAPGCLSSYAPRSAVTALIGGTKMDCIAEVSNESSADQSYSSVDDCMLPRYQHRHDNDTSDGYSTWPRSPRTVIVATNDQAEGILKNGASSKRHPPQTLNFAPMVNIFDETNAPSTTCCGISQVRTPDDFLAEKRGFISPDNSFRDTPCNAKATKYGMPLSRGTPGSKHQHCVIVSPRVHLNKDHHASQNVSAKNAQLQRAPSFQSQADVSHHDCNGCDSNHMSTWPRLRRPINREMSGTTVTQTPTEPVAAPARLIISSPVAGIAEFVENPHKRVLCSPVTTEDLIAFSTCTSPKCQRVPAMKPAVPQTTASHLYHSAPPDGIFEDPSPTTNEMPSSVPFAQCSAFKPVSVPLFPSLSAMKHSIPFPVPNPEKPVERTPVIRSWYDGMHTKVYENPLGEHNEVLRTSLLKESADGGATMRPRRDSNSSTMSTHSSSSSRRSVTFATIHRSSSSSLVTKLDRAVSSSLLCVPEQVINAGVKRSRSTCSSSSGSESSWRHKYAPSSLHPGVAPPVVPTFTTFAKPEPKAKRICIVVETHDPKVDEPVVTQAYQFQVAPVNMSFTGFASIQQTSLAAHTQPFGQQKVKPKVPQRDSSYGEAKVEPQQLLLENGAFSAPQGSSGQSTTETFTLTGNTFVRSYAPPTFVVPKRDTSSDSVIDTTLCRGDNTRVQSSCSDIVNNQCMLSINDNTTNKHAEDSQSSFVTQNGNCVPMKDIARGELSACDVTKTTYSSRLAFLSKNVTDSRSVDQRFSEHLSASCSSLARDHGGSGTAKDAATLGSNGNHVSSMQGLCHEKNDTGVSTSGDIKGDDQSGQLVSPAVSSLSSSGLGSSVASSPDSRPDSPDLTDTPSTGEVVKQSADVCCKT